jgi:hypothetical protein
MLALFKQSYLRPQAKAPRLAAAIGHRNEEPFLKAFYKECKSSQGDAAGVYSFSSLHPVAIFRVGLMRTVGSKFAKASLDGIAFVEQDGDLEMLPTEVKSRVSNATIAEANERLEEMLGVERFDPKKKFLINLSSDDGLLQTLIHDVANPNRKKQEAFQLLHSVHIAGAKQGLLLVGSKDSLLYAVKVTFEEALLDAFSEVLDFIYEQHVKVFYEASVDELKANDGIAQALEGIDFMNPHAFWTTYMVWRALNVDVNASNIWFPLPPCAKCLPVQNGHWNVLKGPSDTTTKLMDNVEEQLGIRTPRTVATARLLSVGTVAFHRSIQMLSAKPSVEYATLFDYRNAANSRFTMGGSLVKLLQYLTDEVVGISAPSASSRQVSFIGQGPSLVPPNSPPRRATRATEEVPERVSWGYYQKTGLTPKRGRQSNEAHKLREQHCDGRVLVAIVADPNKAGNHDVRMKCRLCGTKTNHYCTGCKNYLCFGINQAMNDKRKYNFETGG